MSTTSEFDPTPTESPRDAAVPPQRRTGRHPVNVGHLVMGVAFVGLVVVWALLTSDAVELEDARWILPMPWLVGGAAGIVASVARGPRDRGHHHSGTMQGWQ